jgi:hypothetical protein
MSAVVVGVALAAGAAAAIGDAPAFINPGTPNGITQEFDCRVRQAAYTYGKQLLPKQGGFARLYDALQLHVCGVPPPSPDSPWRPDAFGVGAGAASDFFVDAARGNDANAGDIDHPFATIGAGVAAARNIAGATVNLRAGTYYTDTVQITAENSGLTLQSYNGELAVVSGAVPLPSLADPSRWTPFKVSNASATWEEVNNENNVYGQAVSHNDTATIKYVGSFDTVADCEAGLAASPKGRSVRGRPVGRD